MSAEPNSSALAGITLNNIAISVADLERSVAWYERVLGVRCARRGEFPALEAKVAFMSRPGVSLELVQVPSAYRIPAIDVDPPEHLGPTGYKAIVFDVDDLAAATAELRAHGVLIVWDQALIDFEAGLLSTLVRDPDGNLINFFKRLP